MKMKKCWRHTHKLRDQNDKPGLSRHRTYREAGIPYTYIWVGGASGQWVTYGGWLAHSLESNKFSLYSRSGGFRFYYSGFCLMDSKLELIKSSPIVFGVLQGNDHAKSKSESESKSECESQRN